jgi:MFS family permease
MSADLKLESNITTPEHEEGSSPKAPTESEMEDIFAEDLAYGPDGMRGIIGNSYVFGAAFLASLGGFSFGYDQGVISIINVMDQFHNAFPRTRTAFGTSFMTAMLLLGAFVGCIFMPSLADKISRKWALTVVVIIFDIGAIMQTSAQSYGVLVAGRAIGGIGVGTLAMVCKHLCCSVFFGNSFWLVWKVYQDI